MIGEWRKTANGMHFLRFSSRHLTTVRKYAE